MKGPSFVSLYYRRSLQDWNRVPTGISSLLRKEWHGAVEPYIPSAGKEPRHIPSYLEFVIPHLISNFEIYTPRISTDERSSEPHGVPIPYFPASSFPSVYCILHTRLWQDRPDASHQSAIRLPHHDHRASSRLSRETALHRELRRALTKTLRKIPTGEHWTSV